MTWLKSLALGLAVTALTSSGALAGAATAEIKDSSGESLGTVTLTETPHGVLLVADLMRLTPGGHGFHIHEKGACTPDFKAAGGHFNPAGNGHGINDPDGSLKAEILNAKVTLGPGANSIFDSNGSAIVLHAKPDSHGAAPKAGGRIACGVIGQ